MFHPQYGGLDIVFLGVKNNQEFAKQPHLSLLNSLPQPQIVLYRVKIKCGMDLWYILVPHLLFS